MRVLKLIAYTLLPLAVGLNAQTTNASIYGAISDSSGGVVIKAAVTATNIKTGVVVKTSSNESGVYLFPSLQPGDYRISAEMVGFRQAIADQVRLAVSARVSVDLKLEVGVVTESVLVQESVSPIDTLTTSVSNVVDAMRVASLPLQNRDAGALIALQAGVIGDNFNGARTQSQNVSLDGVNIQESRYNGGYGSANLTTTNSVDRISEFRVSTAPADAESGRGLGQVQMIGKSGTNDLHGTVFEANRVTALSANDWFNNLLGRSADGNPVGPRNFLIRNQFGAAAGAPIRKNKTFAFFLYEGQRQKTRSTVNTTVLTADARQGRFRFFPGVRNGTAASAIPTVDVNGNPVRPAAATGPLESLSVFGRDPNRLAADSTGSVAKALQDYPLPNNFLRGDGLNTAGFYWQRPGTADNNIFHTRIDHALVESTRLAFSMQMERSEFLNGYVGQMFPDQPSDFNRRRTNLFSLSATTALRANLLNEFRAGVNRFAEQPETPFSPGANDVLPHVGTQPFHFTFLSMTNAYSLAHGPQGRRTPVYQFSDKISWLKGRHAIKAGGEVYFNSSNAFSAFSVVPSALVGTGSVPVQNIASIPGIGTNSTAAQNLLLDLSGSLSAWTQAFNSAGGKNPTYIAGESLQRTWRQRSFAGFVQDDWKVSRTVTLNLGVRFDYYGVPFEANGKAVIPVGGSAGAFGVSGTSLADAYQPGRLAGSLTQLQLVGPRSPNPNTGLYNREFNNFSPALGVSWAITPQTVVRAGYAIVYDRNSLRNADTEAGSNPGINSNVTLTSGSALNVANIALPLRPNGLPLSTVPLDDRLQTLRLYDTGLRTPYVQNWNLSVQREIAKNAVLSVRYVGTKGTKLLGGIDINQGEIFDNGFLDAFTTTRAGGNAPLFDRLFAGLAVPGRGNVDGVTIRGSEYARSNATFLGFLADGRVGTFINNLNSSRIQRNENGGVLRAAGLPENFFVTNPQFAQVYVVGNYGNSTYHSFQAEFERRFTRGFVYQGNYTWSKALGESEGIAQFYDAGYRNNRDLSFDKRILNFNRTHAFKSNGIWELPVGKGHALLGNANGLLNSVVGGWKIAGILTWTSGRPLTVTSPYSTLNKYSTGNTPDVVGTLPKDFGALSFDATGACYFCGFTQIADPNTKNIFPGAAAITTQLARKNADGVILQNPLAGTLGNLGQSFFTGPAFFNLDAALTKRIQFNERYNLELRTDWLNAANKQDFANATIDLNINSVNFGRVTGPGTGSNNNRIIVLGGRFNF